MRLRPSRARRALRSVAAAVLWATASAAAVSAASEPAAPVRAPHYGDVLYLFYQGRHFSALTGLMASQAQQRLAPHDDETEILRGGLLLGYGLHREAGEIFARLIEGGAPASVQDRAWFFLAKMRFQRGLLDESEAALDRVRQALPDLLEEDRLLLKGQLLLARGDAAAAARWLDAARARPGLAASRYLRFNLGVALVRSGETARGNALLAELGQQPAPDEEARALRDKANLALGFAALRDGAPRDARAHLQRVRLRSLESNPALLGFGWAAAALDDPRGALVPWMELRSREPGDAAVLEAHLAVPHALAELGAFGQAMDEYQGALAAYTREQAALDASIAAVKAGTLVRSLLERADGETGALRPDPGASPAAASTGARDASTARPFGSASPGPTVGSALGTDAEGDAARLGGFWAIAHLPDMPHAGHLAPVLAGHEFQEAFKSLRDLQFLVRNLDRWQRTLGSYRDMLAHRKGVFEARLPVLQAALATATTQPQPTPASGSLPHLPSLQAGRDALAAELQAAEAAADGAAFATERQARLRALIDRSRATLQSLSAVAPGASGLLPDGTPGADTSERLRRAEGALVWDLARSHPERLWTARKALHAADAGLAQARLQADAIVRAQRDEPVRFAAFSARIDALAERIAALQGPVTAAAAEQQQVVQALAVAVLEDRKERLDGYTQQARFAVAQLHDRALTADASGAAQSPKGETPGPAAAPNPVAPDAPRR